MSHPNAADAPNGDVPATVRAFVNARGVDVPRGGSALDAVAAYDVLAGTADADGVTAGTRVIVDSRALPLDPATPVHGGAIYRTIAARRAAGGDSPAGEDATPALDLE